MRAEIWSVWFTALAHSKCWINICGMNEWRLCTHAQGTWTLMRVLSLSSGDGVEIRLEHTATPSKPSITDFHAGLTIAGSSVARQVWGWWQVSDCSLDVSPVFTKYRKYGVTCPNETWISGYPVAPVFYVYSSGSNSSWQHELVGLRPFWMLESSEQREQGIGWALRAFPELLHRTRVMNSIR